MNIVQTCSPKRESLQRRQPWTRTLKHSRMYRNQNKNVLKTIQCLFVCLFLFSFFFFLLACRMLVPQPGVEPAPSAVEALSLNTWIARISRIMILPTSMNTLSCARSGVKGLSLNTQMAECTAHLHAYHRVWYTQMLNKPCWWIYMNKTLLINKNE